LRSIFALILITDVHVLRAKSVAMGQDALDRGTSDAASEMLDLVPRFLM